MRIGFPERFGPLVAKPHAGTDDAIAAGVFKREMPSTSRWMRSKHQGYHHVLITRAELCSCLPRLD